MPTPKCSPHPHMYLDSSLLLEVSRNSGSWCSTRASWKLMPINSNLGGVVELLIAGAFRLTNVDQKKQLTHPGLTFFERFFDKSVKPQGAWASLSYFGTFCCYFKSWISHSADFYSFCKWNSCLVPQTNSRYISWSPKKPYPQVPR